MGNTIIKPRCRLPVVCTSSYLIGNTINALSKSGEREQVEGFTLELCHNGAMADYLRVLEIASRYVEFY